MLYCGFFTMLWDDFEGLPDIEMPFWVSISFFVVGALIMALSYLGFYVVYAEKIKGLFFYIIVICILLIFCLILAIVALIGSAALK